MTDKPILGAEKYGIGHSQIAPAQADPGVEDDYSFNDQAIGCLIYKGNSVSWWQSKAENYKSALGRAWDAMKAAEFPPDGQTQLSDAITAALASRPSHGELVAALEKFLAKWDQVEPAINNAFAIQHFHGMPYSGPTIETELAELRSALGAGGK